MLNFELKKYHKNIGHEGEGFYCDLWMEGKLIAHVIDEGNGGSPLFQWENRDAMVKLLDHIKTLPEKVYPPSKFSPELRIPADTETFIWDLVNEHIVRKKCQRSAKTKTLFRLKSDQGTDVEYRTIAMPYSEQLATKMRKQYGDNLAEIINETL
jgi:hypothetical protein